jgi:CMP/dCMP kinase
VSAPVIAIDGPSGSGKGTIARRIRAWLGWHLLDSGALYRLVAWSALEQGVPLDDAGLLQTIARDLPVRFVDSAEDTHALLAGRDVSDAIRTERCGAAASEVAAWPEVRAALLSRQRAFQVPPGLVADGRDMGTVVFADAAHKVFLTARAEERARRRYKQLSDKGLDVTLDSLLREILARDARDAQRPVAPLKPADDAVTVDSTGVPIDAVVEQVLSLLPPSLRQAAPAR